MQDTKSLFELIFLWVAVCCQVTLGFERPLADLVFRTGDLVLLWTHREGRPGMKINYSMHTTVVCAQYLLSFA